MGMFEGKCGLILGVFNRQSIAWAIAEEIMRQGGQCGFSYMPDRPDAPRPKNRARVEKLIQDQPGARFLHPMDVTKDEDIDAFMQQAREHFGQIDFLLHSIAFAPPEDLKRDTIDTSRQGFHTAMDISAYSLIAVVRAARELFKDSASVLTMTYFGGEKAVPGYNVMGVCKAALEAIVRYLAFDLGPQGVRVNALSAGPLQTISGRGAGVDRMLALYEAMAPLGRNITHEQVGRVGAFLLSELSDGITAEVLHLDAGYNAMGSPGRLLERLQQAENAGG